MPQYGLLILTARFDFLEPQKIVPERFKAVPRSQNKCLNKDWGVAGAYFPDRRGRFWVVPSQVWSTTVPVLVECHPTINNKIRKFEKGDQPQYTTQHHADRAATSAAACTVPVEQVNLHERISAAHSENVVALRRELDAT